MVLSQEGDGRKNQKKIESKRYVSGKKATPNKALPPEFFETGLGRQSGKRYA